MTKKITLEINIDEDVEKKYPTYRANFRKKEDFLQFLIDEIVVDNSLFGYTIKLVKDERKLATVKEPSGEKMG